MPLSCLFSPGKCYFSASPGKPALTSVGIITPLLLLPCTLYEAVSITPARHQSPINDFLMDSINKEQSFESQHLYSLSLLAWHTVLRLVFHSMSPFIVTKSYEAAIILSIFKTKKPKLRKVKVMCPSSQLRTQVWNEANHP